MTYPSEKPRVKSRYAQLDADSTHAVVSLRPGNAKPQMATKGFSVTRSTERLVLTGEGWQKDVSGWLAHPEMCNAFLHALDRWSANVKQNTLHCRICQLESGFFSYLRLVDPNALLTLKQIDTRWVGDLILWLSQKDADGVPLWSPPTRSGMLIALSVLITSLRSSSDWGHRLCLTLQIPKHPWQGSGRQTTPRGVLDEVTLHALLRACRDDVIQTMNEIRNAWARVAALNVSPSHPVEQPTNVNEWRWLHLNRYTSVIPSLQWIEKNDRQLWLSHRRLTLTHNYCLRPYTPSFRDVVPFVMLLGFVTSFNPDALRQLTLDEIDYPDEFGGERIRLRPRKGRAGRKQIRSFAKGNPWGPDELVKFIIEWTHWLRVIAPPEFRNVLFLVSSPGAKGQEKKVVYATNLNGYGIKASPAWYQGLKAFLKDHGLPALSLAQLRGTSLDQIHEMTNGDLKAVQTAGGQQSPQVILDHYTSDAARKRNDEALASIMLTRERLVRTRGTSPDPRKEPVTADRGSATPGFICLDPFSSPMPNEVEGRLCQSYGYCPKCALACVNRRDPYAAARIIQLRRTVMSAQAELSPRRWLDAWAPVARRLDNYWLPLFDDQRVLKAAGLLTLPPLPMLE